MFMKITEIEKLDALIVAITGDDEELDKKQYRILEIGERLNKPLYIIADTKTNFDFSNFRNLRLLFTTVAKEGYGYFAGQEIVDCIKKDMKRIGLIDNNTDTDIYFLHKE